MQKDLSGFADFFKQIPDQSHWVDREKPRPVEDLFLETFAKWQLLDRLKGVELFINS